MTGSHSPRSIGRCLTCGGGRGIHEDYNGSPHNDSLNLTIGARHSGVLQSSRRGESFVVASYRLFAPIAS